MTGAQTTFVVAVIRDLAPWRDFLAGEVLTDIHARGCCEHVLDALSDIERRHAEAPDECEVRVVTASREVPAEDFFRNVLAVLITDTRTDYRRRKVLMLRYGWARPGFGTAALRWGVKRLDRIRKEKGCKVIETCSGREEKAYERWIGHTLGLERAGTLFRKIYND
jgi:hypothetical protein